MTEVNVKITEKLNFFRDGYHQIPHQKLVTPNANDLSRKKNHRQREFTGTFFNLTEFAMPR